LVVTLAAAAMTPAAEQYVTPAPRSRRTAKLCPQQNQRKATNALS